MNPNFVFNSVRDLKDLRDVWIRGDLFVALIHAPTWTGQEGLELALDGRVGASVALSNPTLRDYDGLFDADDAVFRDVGVGTPGTWVDGVLIHTRTRPVIGFTEVDGLPLATNGGDIHVAWSNGPDRIVRVVNGIIRRTYFEPLNSTSVMPPSICA